MELQCLIVVLYEALASQEGTIHDKNIHDTSPNPPHPTPQGSQLCLLATAYLWTAMLIIWLSAATYVDSRGAQWVMGKVSANVVVEE